MELREFRCTYCGNSLPEIKDDSQTVCCRFCMTTMHIDSAKRTAERYKELLREGDVIDLARCRSALADMVNDRCVEEGVVMRYISDILKLAPEDFEARYYKAFYNRRRDPYAYDNFLCKAMTERDESKNNVFEHSLRYYEGRYYEALKTFAEHNYENASPKLEEIERARKDDAEAFVRYENIRRDMFLCHSSVDKNIVETLRRALEGEGIKTWTSYHNMPWDTDNYWERISQAIEKCRFFVVLSSESSMKRADVLRELDIAERFKKPRLEFRIDESSSTYRFKEFFDGCQWIKLTDYSTRDAAVEAFIIKYYKQKKWLAEKESMPSMEEELVRLERKAKETAKQAAEKARKEAEETAEKQIEQLKKQIEAERVRKELQDSMQKATELKKNEEHHHIEERRQEEAKKIAEENEARKEILAVEQRKIKVICQAIDKYGFARDGKFVFFGCYPQTVASTEAVEAMGTKEDADGYYTSVYDGERYAKVTSELQLKDFKFSTGAEVAEGNIYYFKVEPIKWRILFEREGTALILCENIIAKKCYAAISNNYINSKIRTWLNNDFFNAAFNSMQQSLILTTTVDNSASSTGRNPNQYACANTNDKIFLPSYAEMVNTNHGFNSDCTIFDIARRRSTTDYTRALGAYMKTESLYYGNGDWWLRSPYYLNSYAARTVSTSGHVCSDNSVYHTIFGVVPALRLRLT